MATIHNPPNKLKIEIITVVVSVDENGNEGVLGAMIGNTMYPFVAADPERLKDIIPMAESISKASNIPYLVLQFTEGKDVTESVKKLFL